MKVGQRRTRSRVDSLTWGHLSCGWTSSRPGASSALSVIHRWCNDDHNTSLGTGTWTNASECIRMHWLRGMDQATCKSRINMISDATQRMGDLELYTVRCVCVCLLGCQGVYLVCAGSLPLVRFVSDLWSSCHCLLLQMGMISTSAWTWTAWNRHAWHKHGLPAWVRQEWRR